MKARNVKARTCKNGTCVVPGSVARTTVSRRVLQSSRHAQPTYVNCRLSIIAMCHVPACQERAKPICLRCTVSCCSICSVATLQLIRCCSHQCARAAQTDQMLKPSWCARSLMLCTNTRQGFITQHARRKQSCARSAEGAGALSRQAPPLVSILRELAGAWVGAWARLAGIDSILREPMGQVAPTDRS